MNRYLAHRNLGIRLVGTAAVAASAAVLATVGVAGAAPTPPTTALPGSAAPWVSQTPATGTVPASQQLNFQVWLKPNISSATSFADEVSTPGSSNYRHFISPSEYTAKFGPSAQQADAVVTWLKGQGFTNVTVDAQRQRVSASGAAATVDSAFGTTMKFYQAHGTVKAGNGQLRSNATSLQVPSSLSADILGVTGLDNTAPILPFIKRGVAGSHSQAAKAAATPVTTDVCSQYYGQNTVSLPAINGTSTFPTEVCGYSATQLRAAYGANSANTGKGVTVAFVEGGVVPNMFQTLQDYAQAEGLPAPQSTKYTEFSLGQGPACGTWDGEEQMDVESAYDMAPDINILVAGGDSCSTVDGGLGGQLFDPVSTVLGGNGSTPLASIVSNSWESDLESQPAAWTDIEHSFLLRAAGEGVTMLFSSGDGPGVLLPSSDPYATAVGGTTVGVGQDNGRVFQTGWSTSLYEENQAGTAWDLLGLDGAAGGGASTIWAQPNYQQHVVPNSMATPVGNRGGLVRTVPDISGDADPFTGMAVGTLDGANGTYEAFDIAGTSLAAPLNAGIIAAAEQGQNKTFGFINPLLYKLANSKAFRDVKPQTAATPSLDRYTACQTNCGVPFWVLFNFDVQDPNVTGSDQVTATGYDTMTGLGEPNGQSYVNALRSGH